MAQHQGDVDYDGADGDGGDEVRENALKWSSRILLIPIGNSIF